jgi:hypothetical protein
MTTWQPHDETLKSLYGKEPTVEELAIKAAWEESAKDYDMTPEGAKELYKKDQEELRQLIHDQNKKDFAEGLVGPSRIMYKSMIKVTGQDAIKAKEQLEQRENEAIWKRQEQYFAENGTMQGFVKGE